MKHMGTDSFLRYCKFLEKFAELRAEFHRWFSARVLAR